MVAIKEFRSFVNRIALKLLAVPEHTVFTLVISRALAIVQEVVFKEGQVSNGHLIGEPGIPLYISLLHL
ncbi:hypothetical protein ES705_30551 [subsurface metagenome]